MKGRVRLNGPKDMTDIIAASVENLERCPSCESLRAELATLRGKLRELDARLGGIIEDEREGRGESQYRSGLVVAYEHGRRLLRELGLLEVDDDPA